MFLAVNGCAATRKQVLAEIWLNNGVPESYCQQMPELRRHGFYRKLNNGKYEFISFCKPEALKMISIQEEKFDELLDKLLPEKKK